MDEVWELDGVPDEEDWGVVSGHVPVSFLSVEFDSESPGVSDDIGGSFFSRHGGKPCEYWGHFSNGLEQFGLGVLGHIMSHFKIPMEPMTLGVHNSLGDSFPIEMGKLVNQVEVGNHNGPIFASSDRVLVVVNGAACGGGELF